MTHQGVNSPEHGELVLFTSQDGAVSVSAALERDTVWLTQEQMAQVFQVKRPAITKHLSNIFKTGELKEETTSSVLEHIKNRLLLTASGDKRIADHTLVALTLMIAESKPAERELMINLVMTFLTGDRDA